MNVSVFKALFSEGYRPSNFQVNIGFPIGVAGNEARKVQVLCKGAQIPESTVNSIDVYYMGRQVKAAGNRVFNDVTLTFYADSEMDLRTAFERWMMLMNSHETNIGVTNINLYKGDIEVTALNRAGLPITKYKLIGAFPTSVTPIDLDFSTTDTIAEFSVNFALDYWQTEKIK